MKMDSPMDDEWVRKNKHLLKKEYDIERELKNLSEYGVKCDKCKDLYYSNQLYPQKTDTDTTILVCKYCKI